VRVRAARMLGRGLRRVAALALTVGLLADGGLGWRAIEDYRTRGRALERYPALRSYLVALDKVNAGGTDPEARRLMADAAARLFDEFEADSRRGDWAIDWVYGDMAVERTELRCKLARAYSGQGRDAEALALLEQGLRVEPAQADKLHAEIKRINEKAAR
jgi:hypothetical protein